MAAGPLDTRTTAIMDADNKAYLKAVKENEAADARAAAKRDAAIVKTLSEQGKLTEEAFRTARAQEQAATASSKGLDLVKGKVKEFFTGSLLGGIVQGLGVGIFGNVGSVVQQLFAPPTDEELQRMSDATGELSLIEQVAKRTAPALLAQRREAALAKSANDAYAKTLESITHSGDLEILRRQIDLATKAMEGTGPRADAAAEALKRLRATAVDLVDPSIRTGIEDFYKTFYDKGAESFIKVIRENDKLIERQKQWAAENKAISASVLALQASLDPLVAEQVKLNETYDLVDKARRRGLISLDEEARLNTAVAESLYQVRAAALEAEKARRAEIADLTGEGLVGGFGGRIDVSRPGVSSEDAYADESNAVRIRQRRAEREKEQAKLATMFGESSPFRGIDLVTQGFDALTTAASSAFDALISGSESAGTAFRRALGEMLKGDAIQAGVQVIKEGAWALGSLAFGDTKGAALHAASAAKWALTAAAAGAGAALLGAGGGGGGASAGGGGGASAGGGSGFYGSGAGGDPNGGSDRTIVVGDALGSSSPRFEAHKARRYAALAGDSSDRVRYG